MCLQDPVFDFYGPFKTFKGDANLYDVWVKSLNDYAFSSLSIQRFIVLCVILALDVIIIIFVNISNYAHVIPFTEKKCFRNSRQECNSI